MVRQTDFGDSSLKLNRTQADLKQYLDQFKLNMPGFISAASCSTIPFQRNHGFYGREHELDDISAAFEQQAAYARICTVAVWGTGGIGKSQAALEYAHKQWDQGTPVILWIASETEAEVARSFSNAAAKLQLEGYSETNMPDKNLQLVLQWLQNTDIRWLVVFDNLETEDALKTNMPTVGRGNVLITCRSEFLAESIAIASIEIPAFSVAESTELIFHILDKSSSGPEETEATNNLSEKLGGLALAIDVIAKNTKASQRFKLVSEFLPYYEQNRRALNKRLKRDITYSKDLETA